VHEAAHFFGGRGEVFATDDTVHGFCGGEVVADGADAAEALDEDGDFPVGAALDEALEAAELHDVEAGLLDLVLFVEQDGDFSVSFDAGHWLNDNLLRACCYV